MPISAARMPRFGKGTRLGDYDAQPIPVLGERYSLPDLDVFTDPT